VTYDYTGMNVIMITMDEIMMKGGIAGVLELNGTGGGLVGGWVVDNRCEGELWYGDKLKGKIGIVVGIARSGILFAHGVDTVDRLWNMTAENKQELSAGGRCVTQ
jgi:hypothetical protein